ncbi:MAG: hypothetical protein GXO02_04990 [Epsilonproteobacteria bacterium]|nr:hypothetical protein [Campylobacterota bacterium]
MKKLLKDLYGSGIIFFYYFKYPIVIGLPILYFYLDYPNNWILDIIWLWSLILIIKDLVYKFILKKSYCDKDS